MKFIFGLILMLFMSFSAAQPVDYSEHFKNAEKEIALGQWNYQPRMKFRYMMGYLDSVSVRQMNLPAYYFLTRGDTLRFYWFDAEKQQYFLRFHGGYNYFLASKDKQSPVYHEIQRGPAVGFKDIACGNDHGLELDEAPVPNEPVEGIKTKVLTEYTIDNRPVCRYYTINFFLNAMILRQGMDTLGCVQICQSALFESNKVYQKEMNFGLSLNELVFLPINHVVEYERYMTQENSIPNFRSYLDDIKQWIRPAAINYMLKDTAYGDEDGAHIRGLGSLNSFCNKNHGSTGMSYFWPGFEYILLHETGHIFGCNHVGTGCGTGSGTATIMCPQGGRNGFGAEAIKIIRGNSDWLSPSNCIEEAYEFTAFPCNQTTPLKIDVHHPHFWEVQTDVYYAGKKQYSFNIPTDTLLLNKPGFYTLRSPTTLLSPDKKCIAASEIFIPTGKFIVTDTNSWAEGSLEQVIANCNQCPGLDTITFAHKEGTAIHFKGETPPITDSLFIDGFKGRNYQLGDSLKAHKLSVRIEGEGTMDINTGLVVYGPWFKMQGVLVSKTKVGVADWLYDQSISKFNENSFRLVNNRRGALNLKSNIFANCERGLRWDGYSHDSSTVIVGGADFSQSNYFYHTTYELQRLYNRIGPTNSKMLFQKNFIGKVPGELQMHYFTRYPNELFSFTGNSSIVRSNVFFHQSGSTEFSAINGEFSNNIINRDPFTGEIMEAGETLCGFTNYYKIYSPGVNSVIKNNIIYSMNRSMPKTVRDLIFHPSCLIDSNQIFARYSTSLLLDTIGNQVKFTEVFQDCAKNNLKIKVEGKHGLIKNHQVKVVLFASEKYKNDTSLGFEKVIWDTTFLCGANTFSLMASTASVPVNSRISVIASDITSQFTFGITSKELGTKDIVKQPALFSDTAVCPGNLIKLKRNNYFKNYLVNGVELKDSIWLGKGYHEILVKDSQGCQLKYTRNIGIIKNSILPELKSDSDYLAGDWVKVYRKNTGKILWKNPKYAGADFIDIFKDTIFLVATAKTVTVTQEYTDTATGCTGILTRKLVERKPATNGVENQAREHLHVYPNPAKTALHIYIPNATLTPMLYDQGGRQVGVTITRESSNHYVFIVDKLASGFYTVQCGGISEKVIVVHE